MRRSVWILLLAAVTVLALSALWAVRERRALAEPFLIAAAARSGYAPVTLIVEELGLRSATLRDLRVGEPPDLVVEHADLAWTWDDLARLRIGVLDVRGAHLRVRLGEEGEIDLGSLDPVLAEAEEGGVDAADTEPLAAAVRLERGSASIEAPWGSFALEDVRASVGLSDDAVLPFGGELRIETLRELGDDPRFAPFSAFLATEGAPGPDGELAVRGALEAADGKASLALRGNVAPDPFGLDASLELAPIRLGEAGVPVAALTPLFGAGLPVFDAQLEGSAVVRVPGPDGEAFLGDTELRIARATVELEEPAGSLQLEDALLELRLGEAGPTRAILRRASLSDAGAEPRFTPALLHAEAALDDDGWAVKGSVELAASRARAQLAGVATLEPASFSGSVELLPLDLSPDGLTPEDLFPAAAEQIASAEGRVAAKAELRFPGRSGAEFDLSGEVSLEDLDLTSTSQTRMRGLAGVVRFAGPEPWRTKGIQTLRFALVDVVGALSDGVLRAGVDGDRVEIEAFDCAWAGGRLHTAASLDLAAAEQGLAVEVRSVDLERLISDLQISGLSATGRVSGVVPVVAAGEELRVAAALAAEPAGGVIRWQPAAGSAARLGLRGDLAVVSDALADYHYDSLFLGLEGDLAGDAVLRVALKGHNPSFEAGRPVHLNLNVETNVPSMLLGARSAVRIPEVLERRLRDRVLGR